MYKLCSKRERYQKVSRSAPCIRNSSTVNSLVFSMTVTCVQSCLWITVLDVSVDGISMQACKFRQLHIQFRRAQTMLEDTRDS